MEGPFSVSILKYSALTLDQSALLLSVIFDSYHKTLITRTGFWYRFWYKYWTYAPIWVTWYDRMHLILIPYDSIFRALSTGAWGGQQTGHVRIKFNYKFIFLNQIFQNYFNLMHFGIAINWIMVNFLFKPQAYCDFSWIFSWK